MLSAFRALQHWVARDTALSPAVSLPRTPATAPTLAARPPGARTLAARPELRRLPAGAVMGFELDAHARITCLGGELWVTGPDTDDLILNAGQSLFVAGHGRVVAEALRESRFVVVR